MDTFFCRKPKNARSKRVLEAREPKVNENIKSAIFVRGSQTSAVVNSTLSDLVRASSGIEGLGSS